MGNWIIKISAIIVLGAVCDEIMADGDIKKYLRLAVGLVLTIALIEPFTGGFEDFSLDMPPLKHNNKVAYMADLGEEEQKLLIKTYNRKLSEKLEHSIAEACGIKAEVTVKTSEKQNENFGSVVRIDVKIPETEKAEEQKLREHLANEVGISANNVRISVR